MKNTIKMLALAAGICATVSEANTDYYRISGNTCHSITPGLMGEVSQQGIGNINSTQAMTVACPITILVKNYTEGYISLSAYDRNGNDNLSCTLNFSDRTGFGFSSATSKTAGSSNYNIIYGNGVTVAPPGPEKIPWITCRIPPTYDGGWMSVLTSVYATFTY